MAASPPLSLFSVVGAIAAIAAAVIVEKISDTAAEAAMGELRVQFTHNGRGGGAAAITAAAGNGEGEERWLGFSIKGVKCGKVVYSL